LIAANRSSRAADDQVVVLAATDAETVAHEKPGLGHGVFT
jgi:hypothetical protein